MRRLLLALAAIVISLGEGAAQDAAVPAPPADKLEAITHGGIDDYVLPAHDSLRSETGRFKQQIDAYCSAPTAASRDALRTGFTNLLIAWAGTDFLQFGPLTRQNRFDRFAFWPDPHGTGERQLRQWLAAQDAAMLEPGAIARQSAAVQGLPALERLLFEAPRGLTIAMPPETYRCEVARAVAGNLVAIAAEARAEWDGDKGWRALMLSPGTDNPVYQKPPEPVVELLKALLSGIERLSDQRIQPARGPGPQFAKASRAPYALSGATIAYWRASADSLDRFARALRLGSVLPEADRQLARTAEAEFGNLKSALGAVGNELEPALTRPEPRARLGEALAILRRLRDLMGTGLPGAAGLTPGFNALDGD